MILFIHSVSRPLAVHGKTIKLPRQAKRQIRNIDHFLYFSHSFLEAFAHFITNQFSKCGFILSQFISYLANDFASFWCWPCPPFQESLLRGFHYVIKTSFITCIYACNQFTINRRGRFYFFAGGRNPFCSGRNT